MAFPHIFLPAVKPIPESIDALKNIAVCDTLYQKDHAFILASWKAYCEVLYYYDIILNDPRLHAKERADFHRDFASAYSAGFLKDEREQTGSKTDRNAFISLMNSPGYLEEFIKHKVAEFMNRRLNLNTPTLILGIERTANQKRRKEAQDSMVCFIEEVCSFLPERVRDGFRSTCSSFLNKAFDACTIAEGLTISKNIDFDRDEEKYIHWITDVYRLKKLFFLALRDPNEWISRIKYVDFLHLLDRLNRIPTGLSTDYLESAVSSLRLGEASTVVEHLDSFLVMAAINLFQYILNGGDEEKERRRNLFFQTASSLDGNRQFWEKLSEKDTENLNVAFKMTDDASLFYPKEVMSALKGEGEPDPAIKTLSEWCEKYPALTGPARYLAILYHRLGKPDKAVPYLENAVKKGFWKEGRDECKKQLSSFKLPGKIDEYLEKKDYKGALKFIRTQMKEDPGNQFLLESLIKSYNEWIEHKPSEAESLVADIEDDFDLWMEGAQEQLEERDVRALNRNKHILLTNASIVHLGKLDSLKKFQEVADSMTDLLEKDESNLSAVYYLMIARFQIAINLANERRLDEAVREFKAAKILADRILIEAESEEHRKSAQEILVQIEKVQEALKF